MWRRRKAKTEEKDDIPLEDVNPNQEPDDDPTMHVGSLSNKKQREPPPKIPPKPKDDDAEPEPKKLFWITRAMAEDISREAILDSTFREAVVYVFFVVVATIAIVGKRSPSMYYMTLVVERQFTDTEFDTVNGHGIKFEEIKSAADFWNYAETVLMDSFYWENYYDDGDPVAPAPETDRKILYNNIILGVPRLRQVRVTNDSCIIHDYFRRLFLNCYSTYTENAKEVRPFGPGEGTAWTYSNSAKTGSLRFTGKITTYEGGGYYQDLKRTKSESLEIIRGLKENLWIDRGTRVIFVDFALYNANVDLFAICKIVFEFPPTGGVLPLMQIFTEDLIYFTYTWDYVVFICECVMYVILLFFIAEEVREVIYFKLRYLMQFWTYIDFAVLVLAVFSIISDVALYPFVSTSLEEIADHPDDYGNMEYLGFVRYVHNNIMANLMFFIYVKIFKYLNFNRTMGQLNNTLKRCAYDVLGFSIMFFIIFFAFAELGYLLFGAQVEDYRNFGVAMFTLLRTILGDFDYPQIDRANSVLAPIFFVSYIFFVFFVLINMFLAIINDTYADVKTEIAIAPKEMQMTDYIKQKLYKCLQKFGCCKGKQWGISKADFNATIQGIRDALKKCGFNDLEIEMFFARYNIDPSATIGDKDLQQLIDDMDKQKSRGDDKPSPVQLKDFQEQQERLSQIERTIEALASKMDSLLNKLDAMDRVQKRENPRT